MQRTIPILTYVALGANLGDRAANLRRALDLINETPNVRLVVASKFYENPAVGGPPGAPAFLNAVAEFETTLGSHALLHRLLEIEQQMGRLRRVRWDPRPIDLDLLLYGDQIISSQELVIPHPLMHERKFVLEPLSEIAPEVVHPTLQMTVAGLFANLS